MNVAELWLALRPSQFHLPLPPGQTSHQVLSHLPLQFLEKIVQLGAQDGPAQNRGMMGDD